QRHPHTELAGGGNGAAVRPLPRHSMGRAADRSQHLEARGPHSQRRAVADARAAPRAPGGLRPAAAQGAIETPRGASRRGCPRRPLEASGTSGMKVCCNGGLNLSVLDGWWVEAFGQDNGWAMGAGEEYTDLPYQDDVESRAIYDLLEQEIVPLFYNRSSDGLPRGWIRVMKQSIGSVCPVFNTNRMVQEYIEKCYWPSAERYGVLAASTFKRATE